MHYQIFWSSRGHPVHLNWTVSVDGVDCYINEPSPFSATWFSHKRKTAGLRYEIGLSLRTGKIVWIYGPFKCGSFPDQRIFKKRLEKKLSDVGERAIADNGYSGLSVISKEHLARHFKNHHARYRAKHETVNARFKIFNVLTKTFRHNRAKHGICFHAVGRIVQEMISIEDPLFQL